MLHVAVVAHDARRVPLPLRIHEQRISIRQVHGVVYAQLLPLFEPGRGVGRLPAFVVDQLVLRPGDVGNLEIGILDHVVEHAAVAAVGELPVPVEDEVLILLFGDDVSRQVAPVAFGLDAAVHDVPGHRQRVSVEVFPLVEAFAVEEQLPAVGDFGLGEGVVLGAAGAEAGCEESRPEQGAEQITAWVRFHEFNIRGFLVGGCRVRKSPGSFPLQNGKFRFAKEGDSECFREFLQK